MYVALVGMWRDTKMEKVEWDGRGEERRERKLERGVTKTDGTLGIHLTLKSVSAVFLMCTRL